MARNRTVLKARKTKYPHRDDLRKTKSSSFYDENNVIDFNFYKSDKIETNEIIQPKTENQRLYFKSLRQNTITVASGSAGVGKTIIPAFLGIQLINNENCPIEKFVYIRKNIDDSGEIDCGALPGDLTEKTDPLVMPLRISLLNFMPKGAVDYFLNPENGKFEAYTLRFLKGLTFDNAFVLVDELEDFSEKNAKLVVGRLGNDSKMVMVGDDSQAAHENVRMVERVMECFEYRLDDFGCVRFTDEDCQRHEVVSPALRCLDNL